MNNLASLVLPAIIGLVTGIGHGITSHYLEMPFSLSEQVTSSVSFNQPLDN